MQHTWGKSARSDLVGKFERKSPLGGPKHKWKGNSEMDLKEIVWKGIDWIHLVDDMDQWQGLVKKIMKILIP
jgi:hypothetical protein